MNISTVLFFGNKFRYMGCSHMHQSLENADKRSDGPLSLENISSTLSLSPITRKNIRVMRRHDFPC